MRFSKTLLLAGAAVAAAALCGPAAIAAHGPGLIVFQEDNFGGDSREIRDDEPDLGWVHFDDRISSVQVNRGRWLLCEHSQYRGRCITVDHDIRKLDRLGFDDKTSSIQRLR